MSRIPPEIDDLLWAVAESSNYETADEFVKRYPQYAGELARRRSMVTGLRRRKPAQHVQSSSVPRFKPRSRPAALPRWAAVTVAALSLGAVAVGAYTVTSFLSPPSVKPSSQKPVTYEPLAVGPSSNQEQTPEEPPVVPEEVAPNKPDESEPALVPPPVGTVNFEVQGADLESSLVLLGEEARVSVIVAPGMPSTIIDANYHDQPLEDILLDLGRKYGFTPFDQGDGSIIIVPTRPEDEQNGAGHPPNQSPKA